MDLLPLWKPPPILLPRDTWGLGATLPYKLSGYKRPHEWRRAAVLGV